MTNWTQQQKSDGEFMSLFSREVQLYIGIKDNFPSGDIAHWLLDSFQLTRSNLPNVGDYSFIVVPASKALESWVFKLAGDLGVKVSTDKVGIVRDQIEKQLNIVLDQVEKKLGDSIKIDISYLRNFVQEYRNNIVHCGEKIDNMAKAKSKVIVICERVNSVTEKLIKASLINKV